MIRKDLGMDEINTSQYAMYLLHEDGTIFCRVFGETPEKTENKADLILMLVNNI